MKKYQTVRILVFAISAVMVFNSFSFAKGEKKLSEAAKQAIEEAFPDGNITNVDTGRESGDKFFQVDLKEGGIKKEVGVSSEGIIGEINYKIKTSELPESLRDTVRKKVGRGEILRIEKHEKRGKANSGEWTALPKPEVSYEIKFNLNGKAQSFTVQEEDKTRGAREEPVASVDKKDNIKDEKISELDITALPEGLKNSIQRWFAQGTVKAISKGNNAGDVAYLVDVELNNKEYEAEAESNGEFKFINEEVQYNQLPPPVQQALTTNYQNCRLTKLEKKFRCADKKFFYELVIQQDKQTLEVAIDPEGNVISSEVDRD
ncbi:MAG: PepSY-like domain-containing protein [Planctomycetes bacterium]|nr:PepSY-like domain-containing protein [Planctomycetota bacterium]